MRIMPVWLIVVWSVFFMTPVFAFDTARIEDPEVRECANKALPSKTAYQIQRVEVTGSKGYVRESLRKLYWRRSSDNDSRVLVRVLEPVDDKGVAVLINDDAGRNVVNYMTYSPKLRRVRRVTGESFFGSILGTDFTYEDFSFFYRVDEREEVVRVEDSEVNGFPAYVLETVKPGEEATYSLVRFFIDHEYCLPTRSEFVGLNGELRKELVIDRSSIKKVDDRWVPYRTTMFDLKLNTNSVFTVEEVQFDPDLHDAMFEVTSLKRGTF